jgi:hypothetical protein
MTDQRGRRSERRVDAGPEIGAAARIPSSKPLGSAPVGRVSGARGPAAGCISQGLRQIRRCVVVRKKFEGFKGIPKKPAGVGPSMASVAPRELTSYPSRLPLGSIRCPSDRTRPVEPLAPAPAGGPAARRQPRAFGVWVIVGRSSSPPPARYPWPPSSPIRRSPDRVSCPGENAQAGTVGPRYGLSSRPSIASWNRARPQ